MSGEQWHMIEPDGPRRVRPYQVTDQHMTREERIAERTRDLLDEIVSVELTRPDMDPYPASVGEVADEIARFVLELDASGAARHLASEVRTRLRTGMDEQGQALLDALSPGSVGAGKSADPLPGMWEDSDLHGGEADGYVRPADPLPTLACKCQGLTHRRECPEWVLPY